MPDFLRADLRGSRFERVDLSGAQFRTVDLSDSQFRAVYLKGTLMRGVELVDVDIYGEIENLTINGVDIGPLVNAELDRRYPDRIKMRPTDPAGFARHGMLSSGCGAHRRRARRLDPELLHESVDGEWSFIETLRHLVFATDSWIRRAILGIRRRGIRSTCHGTRCLTPPACPATATYAPPWTWCWSSGAIGWPPCAR